MKLTDRNYLLMKSTMRLDWYSYKVKNLDKDYLNKMCYEQDQCERLLNSHFELNMEFNPTLVKFRKLKGRT